MMKVAANTLRTLIPARSDALTLPHSASICLPDMENASAKYGNDDENRQQDHDGDGADALLANEEEVLYSLRGEGKKYLRLRPIRQG